MHTGIHVGGAVLPEAVTELRATILEILNARADQETIRCALQVLAKGVSGNSEASNFTISNCSVTGITRPAPQPVNPPSFDENEPSIEDDF